MQRTVNVECPNSVGNFLCSTSYWTKGLSEPSASYLYIFAQSLGTKKLPASQTFQKYFGHPSANKQMTQ